MLKSRLVTWMSQRTFFIGEWFWRWGHTVWENNCLLITSTTGSCLKALTTHNSEENSTHSQNNLSFSCILEAGLDKPQPYALTLTDPLLFKHLLCLFCLTEHFISHCLTCVFHVLYLFCWNFNCWKWNKGRRKQNPVTKQHLFFSCIFKYNI